MDLKWISTLTSLRWLDDPSTAPPTVLAQPCTTSDNVLQYQMVSTRVKDDNRESKLSEFSNRSGQIIRSSQTGEFIRCSPKYFEESPSW